LVIAKDLQQNRTWIERRFDNDSPKDLTGFELNQAMIVPEVNQV